MIYIKQPNNLYTQFDEESGGIVSINTSVDDIVNWVMKQTKHAVENTSVTLMKAAATYDRFLELAADKIYLDKVGYNGTVDEFAKSIEKGPVAVKEVEEIRKERWGRCPNCGTTLWYKERGDYNEYHYKCGCGQMINWNKLQWYSEENTYLRCDGKMPGALLVVMEHTTDTIFNSSTMIRLSTIIKSIPDITIGEYVILESNYDLSWSSNKYIKCDGRMTNSLEVVSNSISNTEFDELTMIRYNDVQLFIPDIKIGDYVVLKDYYDEGFDDRLEDIYVRCPSDMFGALVVVNNTVNDGDYDSSTMIKLNVIRRYIPTIVPGEYVIVVENYDTTYNGITYVACPSDMPLAILVLDDETANTTNAIAYNIARMYVNDISIGNYVIDSDYYDIEWNQYDTNKSYAIIQDPTDEDKANALLVVADTTPMSKFDRTSMIKYSSIKLLNPGAKVGDYIDVSD